MNVDGCIIDTRYGCIGSIALDNIVYIQKSTWCSGRVRESSGKEQKEEKMIWEGYKRQHKGQIPPKVGLELVLVPP